MLPLARYLARLQTLSIPRSSHRPHSHRRKPTNRKLNCSRRALQLAASDVRVESRLVRIPVMSGKKFTTRVNITLGQAEAAPPARRCVACLGVVDSLRAMLTHSRSAVTPRDKHLCKTADLTAAYLLPKTEFAGTQKLHPAREYNVRGPTMGTTGPLRVMLRTN